MPKVTFLNPIARPGQATATQTPLVCVGKRGESLLAVAEEHGARVGHACGGNLACSTCHVWISAGLESLGEISDKENDIMDRAFDVRAESRLGCQALLGDDDVVVEITEEGLRAWLDENPDARKVG